MIATGLKRTPFYDMHVSLGAKIVPFAGFEMPVQYPTGITREHEIVRTGIGVFDVSHMGEFEITGPDRNAFVNRVTCNDVSALSSGQAQYSAILTEDGTFVDDCLVYRFDDKLMMVVNASNIEKDWKHMVNRKAGINVRLKNISDDVALLAVQGPKAESLMQSLTKLNLTQLGYYHFDTGQVAGIECFVSRTGYTGEDGFEIYFRPKQAEVMWHAVVGQGRGAPIGLGARDSLRLEAGYPLYGNDIDDTTNPYEAGLGWIVKLSKGAPFTGRAALERVKAKGPTRKLVGFTIDDPAAPVPEECYLTVRGTDIVGRVTSAVRSAAAGDKIIGLAYVAADQAEVGKTFDIKIAGGRLLQGRVVPIPFYDPESKRQEM